MAQIDDTLNLDELIADLKSIENREVEVGVFDGANLKLAAIHEFGVDIEVTDAMRGYLAAELGIHLRKDTTHIKIPERAPLRRTADDPKWLDEVQEEFEFALEDFLLGKVNAKQVLNSVGLVASNGIRDRIVSGEGLAPPNHPATVAKKGSARPLVDDGELARSYTFRVK